MGKIIKTLKTTKYITNTPEEIINMENNCTVPIVRSECITQYARDGRETMETHKAFSVEGECYADQVLTFSYDEKGRLLSKEDEFDGHKTYSYSKDAEGNTVVDVSDEGIDGITTTWKRVYSPDGMMLKEEIDGENGTETMEYEYDPEGRILRTVNESFEVRTTCEYSYDGEDVTIRKTVYFYVFKDEDAFTIRTVHNGNTVEEVETDMKTGMEISRTITTRIQDGNGTWHPVDVRHIQHGGRSLHYTYEYSGPDYDLIAMTKDGPAEGHREVTSYRRTYWDD